MSKSLSTVSSLDQSIGKIRDYHRLAMNGANQTVAAAIFAGLELLSVQQMLKAAKDAPPVIFLQWFEQNENQLGFSLSTKDRYMRLASGIKPKLKAAHPELDRLLSLAPSQMNDAQALTLMKALHKSVDGESLTELYEDFGIVKERRTPTRTLRAGDGAPPPMDVPIEQQVEEQLELFATHIDAMHKTVKLGNDEVLLATHWPAPKLDTAIEMLKRTLATLVKVRSARKS